LIFLKQCCMDQLFVAFSRLLRLCKFGQSQMLCWPTKFIYKNI
jgi:hypothetical protein